MMDSRGRGIRKRVMPALAVLALGLSACGGPSLEDFRQDDPDGNTACIHFVSGYTDDGAAGRTNLVKAADHGSRSTTAAIRNAVSTDESGTHSIIDKESFKKACNAQGMNIK